MKKVIEQDVYLTKNAKALFEKIDFKDTFSTTNHQDDLKDIARLIFDSMPSWVSYLFKIRNTVVNMIGLKTSIPEDYNTAYKVGGYIGFFKIYQVSEKELIMGADDKHLNFRAVINLTSDKYYNIKVTTLVKFNNKMGKTYMRIVAPFHRIVIMAMIKKGWKN